MTSSAGPGCHPVLSWTGHGPVSGQSFDTVSPASTSAHTQQSGHPYGAPCKTCDRALGGQNCCICDNTFGSILEGCLQAYNKKYLPHRFATCLELRDSAVFTWCTIETANQKSIETAIIFMRSPWHAEKDKHKAQQSYDIVGSPQQCISNA